MKRFGTVESFDSIKGLGLIKPEVAGTNISFETSAIAWENKTPPPVGQRLSYEVSEVNGATRAIGLLHA